MSDVFAGQGSCLCGAVGFSAENAAKNLGACHCGMCRKWGGGPAMMVPCADAVSFSGDENIGVFASSEWAERGFCTSCGSHLFYRVRETHEHYIPAGLFDDQDQFSFAEQVCIEQKPAFYAFANDTKTMTQDQLFEQASPDE